MHSKVRLWTMTLAAGLLLMPAAYVHAQTAASPLRTIGPSTAPSNIPDSKLDAAATAAMNAADVKEVFDQKMALAPAIEKQRIAVEADDAMVKAVTDQGLSLDEFKAIMRLAQNDPDIRSKFLQRLK